MDGKGDELPIVLVHKRQQWVRKDLGTRKNSSIAQGRAEGPRV